MDAGKETFTVDCDNRGSDNNYKQSQNVKCPDDADEANKEKQELIERFPIAKKDRLEGTFADLTGPGHDIPMEIKCVLVGDSNVGKARIIERYTKHTFDTTEYPPITLFDSFHAKVTVDEVLVNLTGYYTPGLDDYERLRPLFYPGTDVFLMCFSVTQEASYANISASYYPQVQSHCPTVPVILVGTQIDLRTDKDELASLRRMKKRPIEYAEGLTLAKKIGAVAYVECSAWTQEGLNQVFDEAVRAVIMQKRAPKTEEKKLGLLSKIRKKFKKSK